VAEIDLLIEPRGEAGSERAVLEVAGDIDLFTAPQLRHAVNELIDAGSRKLVVDLTKVGFLDSTGLGVLVGALKRLRDSGGDLVLAAPQRPVRRVLSVTGLDKVFTIHTDPTESQISGAGVTQVGDATAVRRS